MVFLFLDYFHCGWLCKFIENKCARAHNIVENCRMSVVTRILVEIYFHLSLEKRLYTYALSIVHVARREVLCEHFMNGLKLKVV